MSSSVFYKFRNSKDAERILFHGTTISVFELKREIMQAARLGDGTDINLHIYPEDQPTQEYTDDTTLIPRSSTVIAVRRPAPRGQGRAARYVSARAPVRAIKKHDAPRPAATGGAPQTEQDAEAAFLAQSAQAWEQQKESLAHAKPVFSKHKKHVDVPAHDPPPGYVCYRCSKKGHWIQACPTNDDPDFKPAARAKRTTGIPRSFLKTVAKPEGDLEDARGIMLNADGEYVQVQTDNTTWEKFQEKMSRTKAKAEQEAAEKEKEGSKSPKSPSAKDDAPKAQETAAAKPSTPPATNKTQSPKPQAENEKPGQKRKTPPTDIQAPSAPKAMRQQPPQQQQQQGNILDQIFGGNGGMPAMPPMPGMMPAMPMGMPMMGPNGMMMPPMPGMPMPNMPMQNMPPNQQNMPPNMQNMPYGYPPNGWPNQRW